MLPDEQFGKWMVSRILLSEPFVMPGDDTLTFGRLRSI